MFYANCTIGTCNKTDYFCLPSHCTSNHWYWGGRYSLSTVAIPYCKIISTKFTSIIQRHHQNSFKPTILIQLKNKPTTFHPRPRLNPKSGFIPPRWQGINQMGAHVLQVISSPHNVMSTKQFLISCTVHTRSCTVQCITHCINVWITKLNPSKSTRW